MISINPGTAATLGGGLGAALGQIGDVLSMPRRALWGAIGNIAGLPEGSTDSGASLLSSFGMDPDSPLTKLLGFGAEIAGDPLTYAGGLAGRLASAAGPRAGLLSRIDDLTASRNLAKDVMQSHLAENADLLVARPQIYQTLLDQEMAKIPGMMDAVSPDSLAMNMGRTYARPDQGVADFLAANPGLGAVDQATGKATLTGSLHPQFTSPVSGQIDRLGNKGIPPSFMGTSSNRYGPTLMMQGAAPGGLPNEQELEMIRALARTGQELPSRTFVPPTSQFGQVPPGRVAAMPQGFGLSDIEHGMPLPPRSNVPIGPTDPRSLVPLSSPANALNPEDVFQQIARNRAAQGVPPLPEIPMMGNMPVDEYVLQQNNALRDALAQLKQAEAQAAMVDQMAQYGLVAGAGGMGFGLGQQMWGQ